MDSADWEGIGDDEENQEESGQVEFAAGRDGIIVLIDFSKEMFVKTEDGSAFDMAIKSTKSLMTAKILSSDKDLMAVVFYGTESTENSADFKHITVFQDLNKLGREEVKAINDIITDRSIQQKYGHSDQYSLSDAFWICSSLFSKCTVKLQTKRIFLFTNNDNPHGNDAQLQNQTMRRAKDLAENGIAIELLGIKNDKGEFKLQTFYKDLLKMNNSDSYGADLNGSGNLDMLLSRVRSKNYQKRKMASLTMTLGGDMKIGVGVYVLVRPTNVPFAVKLDRGGNEALKSIRKTFTADTGEILTPAEVHKVVTYSEKVIKFDPEEIKNVSRMCETGIVLLGFKPLKSLKLHHFVKPSWFIYPSEEIIHGSTSVFTALLTKCLEKKVMAICRYTPRSNSPPALTALIPQKEECDDNNQQLLPEGFHVLILPFAEDLRHLPFDAEPVVADQDQIDAAKKIIEKLRFSYNPVNFENPVLQTHWHNVESLALDLEVPEKTVDYAKPNDALIEKRAGKLIEEFKNLVFPPDYEPPVAGKRKASTAPAAKKVKLDPDSITTVEQLLKIVEDGSIKGCTVAMLKKLCALVKIKVSNKKKDDLIGDLYNHFDISM